MLRSLLVLCVAALAAPAAAFAPASVPTLRSARAPAISMQAVQERTQVDILDKVETLKVLTALSNSGVLSKIERSGLLSKLESSGALSAAEKYLPIADEIGAISLLKNVVNTPPAILNAGVFALVAANIGLIAAVPDTSNELIAAQVASVPLFLALAAPLFIGAKVLDVIQGDEPVDLSGLAKLLD